MNTTTKKKILFLVTKGNCGGAQRYVFDVATALPKEKFEAVVYCGEGDALPEKLAGAGIRCARVPSLGREVGSADFAAFREIFQLLKTEQPDILHLSSSKAAALGACAAVLYKQSRRFGRDPDRFTSGLKTIFTVHGWPFNEPRPFVERVAIFLLSWLTALLSHEVIVICSADRRSAERLPFIHKKTRLIHNGIEPFAVMERIVAREAFAPHASADTVLIVTIAELTKNKGLAHALRAVATLAHEQNLPPFQYVIIGEGELRQELEKIISEKNLASFAHLVGFVPDAKTLLSGADIFILPSLKEGLPYVLLEAGAAGVPVVATNVGGISDIISDMESGMLIRAKREKEIADALRFLLTNHKKRDAFGAALKQKVFADFSFEKMLAATIAAYES
ncbi:MAG: glycosyltransferase [bacterium]|nr:glycosyltransferase [bacterium]